MTALNTFIQNHVPAEFRHGRDFVGPRGWVYMSNRFLSKCEREGILKFDRRREVGVEVEDERWISLPSDYRRILSIYYPPTRTYRDEEYKYPRMIVNGKLKLDRPFDKKATPDTFTLSSGSTTQITIDDDDAEADEWEKYLLVPTNGTYRNPIIIGEHDAASGGTTVLDFLHAQSNVIDSTAGYLTDQYLMLAYESSYDLLSAYDDEIPITDVFEDCLADYLTYMAMPFNDKRRREAERTFLSSWEELLNEQFTESQDQMNPESRPMAAYEDCDVYNTYETDYIGDGNES